jgi:hypothetical protein
MRRGAILVKMMLVGDEAVRNDRSPDESLNQSDE